MKKVTILALHLGYGGIENAVATLANTLSSKYEVEILSVYRLYNDPVFKINSNIKITYISNVKPNKKEMIFYLKKKNYKMFFKGIGQTIKTAYVKYIKTAIELRKLDSDTIITTRIVHNNMSALFVKKEVKKIAWEHNHHNNNKKYIMALVNSCKKLDYLVTVSHDLKEFYEKYLGSKVCFIPNSLDDVSNKKSKLNNKNIISIGRLCYEKGFDDLIKVFKKVLEKNQDAILNIVGDGVKKDELLKLVEKEKLYDKVIFHGYQNKEYINELLLNSSLYVMTSHTESFGLVLIEAMNYGLPCISYTSAQGANEIIEDEKDGFLIKDRCQDEMVSKINLILNDDKLRNKMGKCAKEKSKEYAPLNVEKKWSLLINKRK